MRGGPGPMLTPRMTSTAAPASPSPSHASASLPRWTPGALQALHALLFAWAAWLLPWDDRTLFAGLASVLALAHAAAAATTLTGHARRAGVWRVQSWVALAFLAWLAWSIATTAAYLAGLYGALGQGVAAVLVAVLGLAGLVTVPLAAWGLVATGGVIRGATEAAAVTAVVAILVVGVAVSSGQALPTPLPTPGSDAAGDAAALALAAPQRIAPPTKTASLMTRLPADCPAEPAPGSATVLATLRARGADAPETWCGQAPDAAAALDQLASRIAERDAVGPVKVDIVSGVQALASVEPLVDGLLIRAGLDGVCAGARCLAPWQLNALDQFTTNQPLSFIADLRFGASAATVHELLGGEGSGFEGLTRIETRSLVLDADGAARPMSRIRSADRPLDATTLDRAIRSAERWLVGAQRSKTGRFRSTLDPFTGKVTDRGFSVRRQAGATHAACDAGADSEALKTLAARSLKWLARQEREYPIEGQPTAGVIARMNKWKTPEIASTGLTLATLVACRRHVGDRHDALISRLTRLLLHAQREDGGFHMRVDRRVSAPIDGPTLLYAGGQVVLGLARAESLAASTPGAIDVPLAQLHDAVERAMSYIAGPFWDHAGRDFFYIEENWHCLAAAAALPVHRHDGYERFCLDYITFQTRLILDEESDVEPSFVGGMGFGNQLPPHNTPTAGYGETLAAAAQIAEARGLDTSEQQRVMRSVLAFLVAQQWQEEDCFACSRGAVPVVGAWSESMASPLIRVDYIQHALSALVHGGRLVGLVPPA